MRNGSAALIEVALAKLLRCGVHEHQVGQENRCTMVVPLLWQQLGPQTSGVPVEAAGATLVVASAEEQGTTKTKWTLDLDPRWGN